MREIYNDIHNELDDIDMLYFIYESSVRNYDLDAIEYLMVEITNMSINLKNFNLEDSMEYYDFFLEIVNSINLNQKRYDLFQGRYTNFTSAAA